MRRVSTVGALRGHTGKKKKGNRQVPSGVELAVGFVWDGFSLDGLERAGFMLGWSLPVKKAKVQARSGSQPPRDDAKLYARDENVKKRFQMFTMLSS